MGKLAGNDLEYIACHYEDISSAYATQIYFCFDSKESGERAFDILKRVYAKECNYDAWSGWFGSGDKRDFYLGFTTKQVRDDVLGEIKESIAAYRVANPDISPSSAGKKDDPEEEKPAGGLTTYIIIGAAAAIIIALLIPWKKK